MKKNTINVTIISLNTLLSNSTKPLIEIIFFIPLIGFSLLNFGAICLSENKPLVWLRFMIKAVTINTMKKGISN